MDGLQSAGTGDEGMRWACDYNVVMKLLKIYKSPTTDGRLQKSDVYERYPSWGEVYPTILHIC